MVVMSKGSAQMVSASVGVVGGSGLSSSSRSITARAEEDEEEEADVNEADISNEGCK